MVQMSQAAWGPEAYYEQEIPLIWTTNNWIVTVYLPIVILNVPTSDNPQMVLEHSAK